MVRNIYHTKELTEKQIKQIYSLHYHFYYKRNNGFEFSKWKENLLKKYHGKTEKKIQITTDNSSGIIGYSIFTDPIEIRCEKWSKILEGGFYSNNSKNDFVNMILDLTHNNLQKINYFSEISVDARLVLYLMKKSGFNQIFDSRTDYVFDTYIGKESYRFIDYNNGMNINRKTGLKENYLGNIITKRHIDTNSTLKKQFFLEETV